MLPGLTTTGIESLLPPCAALLPGEMCGNDVIEQVMGVKCKYSHIFLFLFPPPSIHEIERRALPEFFNGKNKSKTPEM